MDYRKLNQITKKVAYPLPRTEDTFDYLQESTYFTKLDAAAGYRQIPLDDEAKSKSAIVTPGGQFQWLVMPFGLCNAPATFQKMMDCVLAGLKWQSCLVYLDDILIFSKSWREHLEYITQVFQIIKEAGISLKLSKCEFGSNSTKFLGHMVEKGNILPDPVNIKAIEDFSKPNSLTSVRSFLGMAGHYRRFIPNFADRSLALRVLTKKNSPFVWGKEQELSFQDLKQALSSSPILQVPKFEKPFIITTDASNTGISGVLSQGDEEGVEYVLSYRSRPLTVERTA